MIEEFKFTPEMEGQTFEVRFLPNPKDSYNLIYGYKVGFNNFGGVFMRNFMALALINGEIKYFKFGNTLHKKMGINFEKITFFQLNENLALKVLVNVKQGFIDLQIEKINDNKFILDDGTQEAKESIKKLLTEGVDLKQALFREFLRIRDVEVDIAGKSVKLESLINGEFPDWKSEIREEKLLKILG